MPVPEKEGSVIHLSILLAGQSKAGKSTLALTAPGPTLLVDWERGGGRFVPGKKTLWDPEREDMPQASDLSSDSIVRVRMSELKQFKHLMMMLKSKPHPFRSVVLDSISEMQERVIYSMDPKGKLGYDGWGDVLAMVLDLLVEFNDMLDRQEDLDMVVLIVGTAVRNGREVPMMQGQIVDRLGYKLDINGYVEKHHSDEGPLIGLRLAPDELRGINAGGRGLEALSHPEVWFNPDLTQLFNRYTEFFS